MVVVCDQKRLRGYKIKVQRGEYHFFVCVPHKIARDIGLEKGSVVEFEADLDEGIVSFRKERKCVR